MMDQISNLKSNLEDSKHTQKSLIRALENAQSTKMKSNSIDIEIEQQKQQQQHNQRETEMLLTIKNLSLSMEKIEKRCENAENKYANLKKS